MNVKFTTQKHAKHKNLPQGQQFRHRLKEKFRRHGSVFILPLTNYVIFSSLGSHFSLSLYFFTNKGVGPKNFPHFSQFKDLAKAMTQAHSKPLSLVGFAGCSWEHYGSWECRGLKRRGERMQKIEEGKGRKILKTVRERETTVRSAWPAGR